MAAPALQKQRSMPYGWSHDTDASGTPYFKSRTGEAVYDLDGPLAPCFAMENQAAGTVQEWCRFFDTATQRYYYAHSFTTEATFDMPPLYLAKSKEGLPPPPFQTAAIRIQCLARKRRGRVRVDCRRAVQHQRFAGSHARYVKTFHPHYHAFYWCNPKSKTVVWEQPHPSDEYDFSTGQSTRFPTWYRLWDPAHKQHYYYNTFEGRWQFTQPAEWNAAMWAFGYRAGYPPMLKAAMTIQTRYRHNTVTAKIASERKVRERMTPDERARYMQRRAVQLAEKKRLMIHRREQEREANERAALAHEESMQCVRGDRFWGVDVAEAAKAHAIEAKRKAQERKAAAERKRAEDKQAAIDRRKRMKMDRRTDMKRELAEIADMTHEESEQRNYGDAFWGVDKEERDRRQGLRDMAFHDDESHRREAREKLQAMHATWGHELEQAQAQERLSRANAELERRGAYMGMFYDSTSSDQVINYVWPGSRSKRDYSDGGSAEGGYSPPPARGGFGMDEVYSKKRLTAPASIYHALNPLRSAPPRAARDFLLQEQQGEGYVLLPHLHKCRGDEMKMGAVPPEMVQRQLDSRQWTASASLRSPSRAEAKRLREREMKARQRRRRGQAGNGVEEDEAEEEQEDGMGRTLSPRTPATDEAGRDEGKLSESVLDMDADVRGVLRRGGGSGGRRQRRKTRRARRGGGEATQSRKRGATQKRLSRRRGRGGAGRGSPGSRGSPPESPRSGGASAPPPPPPPPPPPVQLVISLSDEQRDRLRLIFDLMDTDHSGMVSQHEMMVALRTNKEVISFVSKSKLLAPLLLDAEFSRTFMSMDPNNDGGVSFEEFVDFMQENSSEDAVVADMEALSEEADAAAREAAREKKVPSYDGKLVTALGESQRAGTAGGKSAAGDGSRGDGKSDSGVGALLRRVFKQLDTNDTGNMGRREFLFALKGVPDIRDFVAKSPPLERLVKHKKFKDALAQLNDPMTQLEFVDMGVEIALQLDELEKEAANRPDPLTAEEIDTLNNVVVRAFNGEREVSKARLTRMLLSTKVSAQLLGASDALGPLLKPRTFRKTLADLDTDKDNKITTEEVVAFCVEFVKTQANA